MKTISSCFIKQRLIVFLVSFVIYSSFAWSCEESTPALQSMQQKVITFQDQKLSKKFMIKVNVAKKRTQRSAGFQHVCKKTIAKQPILFLFREAIRPQFHMYNVHAPLDIAFIDEEGEIISIQAMNTYDLSVSLKPLYGTDKSDTQAVLEAYAGFFKENGISVGWKLGQLNDLIDQGVE